MQLLVKDSDGNETGEAAYFNSANRGKKSLTLDIAAPEGQEIVRRLAAKSDVLLENFKTGTLEKWGIGFETLSERFPRLIHCRVSGFGADGKN